MGTPFVWRYEYDRNDDLWFGTDFEAGKTIRPGQTVKLEKRGQEAAWAARKGPFVDGKPSESKPLRERVVIVRVAFEDGTQWLNR